MRFSKHTISDRRHPTCFSIYCFLLISVKIQELCEQHVLLHKSSTSDLRSGFTTIFLVLAKVVSWQLRIDLASLLVSWQTSKYNNTTFQLGNLLVISNAMRLNAITNSKRMLILIYIERSTPRLTAWAI